MQYLSSPFTTEKTAKDAIQFLKYLRRNGAGKSKNLFDELESAFKSYKFKGKQDKNWIYLLTYELLRDKCPSGTDNLSSIVFCYDTIDAAIQSIHEYLERLSENQS